MFSLLLSLVSIGWLVPGHYFPWMAFAQDGLTLIMLTGAVLYCERARPLTTASPITTAIAATVAAFSVLAQLATGKVVFFGDAVLALTYISALCLAFAGGTMLAKQDMRSSNAIHLYSTVLALCSAASVLIALIQWTGAWNLGVYVENIAVTERPFGNLGQPNNFSTVSFLGLCSIGLLFSERIISKGLFWIMAFIYCLGMVMSGSRTGILQVALLVLALLVAGTRIMSGRPRYWAAGLFVLFTALHVLWPAANEALLLSNARNLAEEASPGLRKLHWAMAVDAIWQSPWTGYGWQQVTFAQQEVALRHPAVGEMIEHVHNVALDVLLWAGLPFGGVILLAFGTAFLRQWHAINNPKAAWFMLSATGILMHGLLEYPLEYAYLLVPFGISMGASFSLCPFDRSITVPGWAVRSTALAFAGLLTWIAIEYLEVEDSNRAMRLEMAGIGVTAVQSKAPNLTLLTHLEAYLRFARTEAHEDMTTGDLEAMQRVSRRFAYPPSMFRFALAAGLNGRPELAATTLARMCAIHLAERCDEGREAWARLQKFHPALASVRYPTLAMQAPYVARRPDVSMRIGSP